MNPNRGYTGFVGRPSFFSRSSWRRLLTIAIAVLLLLPVGANPAQAVASPASGPSTAHVYLLRGVLNIFSLGLDDIAAKLRAQGVPVTVLPPGLRSPTKPRPDTGAASSRPSFWSAIPRERPRCPTCGGELQERGKQMRKLTTHGEQTVQLTRSYGYCPTCRVGFFLPG